MGFFKKDNKLIKNENVKDSKKLSKYLPSLLFVSTQKDINEKALKSYITSIAKSSFDNLNEVKYSIKKVGKNEYLYEIHNGSRDLTYLNLVHKSFYQEAKNEIILKASNQNVKVMKRSNGKLESVLLLESKNRDDEAIVDYNTKGALKEIVKEGTAFFMFSTLFFAVSGLLASSSFFTKYYMLNEEYSLDLDIKNIESPRSYVSTVDVSSHSKYHYVKNITFNSTKGWTVDYVNIEVPVEEVKIEVPVEEVKIEVPVEEVKIENNGSISNVDSSDNMSSLDLKESNQDNIAPPSIDVKSNIIESAINVDVDKAESEHIEQANVNNKNNINESIDLKINDIIEDKKIEKEDSVSVLDTNNQTENEFLEIDSLNIEDVKNDEFEIIDENNISNLDLSNLPDNIVLEEGVK